MPTLSPTPADTTLKSSTLHCHDGQIKPADTQSRRALFNKRP
ncbi:hypothetical protein FOXYSP1_16250 [Fusarium oxysporum f. sp. phaseoli]